MAASVGTLLGSQLVASGCLVRAPIVDCADDGGVSCRIALANSGSALRFLMLGSWGQKKTPTRQEKVFSLSCEATAGNGAMPWNSASGSQGVDVEKYRSRLEALLYCGKEVPEEKIEKPTGLPPRPLAIGNKPKCFSCEAKGAIECPTCTGSGLYVDSILESQGIIVKVKCLGCGGTGSTMCPKCGGRGHALGPLLEG